MQTATDRHRTRSAVDGRALEVTMPGGLQQPQGNAMKFTHPSGSRPLDGYTIKRGIGRGGFGEVYYATSDGGKEVALKLIRRNLDVELRGVGHCLNLKHPNLLAIHDIKSDEHDDRWVVMEYVSGKSLEDVIQSHPEGLEPEEAMSWFQGIVAGVAYLHDHGIVHRDLKPGNIFSDEGLVKIGDYGLSKFVSCSRRSGQTESVGTVHYMAPEVANGRYGKEIDIYALGIVLFEMLTGHVPFEGESVGEVLMKHLTAEPDLSQLRDPYRAVIAKALTKDPAKRFRSVNEMIAMLPAAQAAGPTYIASAKSQVILPGPHLATAVPPPQAKLVNSTDEEPIWQAIRQSGRQLVDAWQSPSLGTGLKLAILFLVGVILFYTQLRIFALFVPFLMAYAVYYFVRMIVLDSSDPVPANAPVAPAAGRPPETPANHAMPLAKVVSRQKSEPRPKRRKRLRRAWGKRTPAHIPPKTFRDRLTELSGMMLLSVFVATVLSVCTFLLFPIIQREILYPSAGMDPAMSSVHLPWLAIVATLATWPVLVLGKVWEGRSGEPILRRFILGVTGLAVGGLAYLLASHLFVPLPELMGNYSRVRSVGSTGIQIPEASTFLLYFALNFALLRWWRLVDPRRSHRLSLWSLFVACIVAFGISIPLEFPQPWGVIVIAVTSLSIQLASPLLENSRDDTAHAETQEAV